MKHRSPIVASVVIALLSVAPGVRAQDDEPAAPTTSAAPATSEAAPKTSGAQEETMSGEELDRLLTRVLDAQDKAARKEAIKAATELSESELPVVTKKLAELRKTSTVAIHAALKHARSGEGHDLLDSLLDGKGGGSGHRAAVSTIVLMRALTHMGTTPAARELTKVVGDHKGAFRLEASRQVKVLGEAAIPALIETRKQSSDIRRWGSLQLEGMGKRLAGDAVQTKSNEVLADVLRAFGVAHDLDAVPVILSFVNSDRVQVRKAARESLLSYGQDAVWKLREAYSNLTGKSAPDGWNAEQVAKELYAAFDHFRMQEVYSLFEDGLKKNAAGDVEGAIAAFDKVLARQPMLDRRAEMVGAYVTAAQRAALSDTTRALGLLRKAARLDPDGPRANQIKAEIAYVEGKELLAKGIADTASFEKAVALDPTHDRARAELGKLREEADGKAQKTRGAAGGIAVLLLAIAGIVLFGGGKRAARPRSIA
ncbi:MAG: hypothetical protein KC657_02030 [Myxococcales bacterium]|nr:hypothetical protein [Myxococcales bacterium]